MKSQYEVQCGIQMLALVTPRSQDVVNFAVETAKEKGALKTFTDTPAIGFEIENGRITGVKTDKGLIKTNKVVITSGIWGPLMGDMAGVQFPNASRTSFVIFWSTS